MKGSLGDTNYTVIQVTLLKSGIKWSEVNGDQFAPTSAKHVFLSNSITWT